MDEEDATKERKKRQFHNELNKTAIRMKTLAAQYAIMIENKNILTINDIETQEKIIKLSNIMENFMEGQKLVINQLINEGIKKD